MTTGAPEALTLEQELSRLLPRSETHVLYPAPVQAGAADEAEDDDGGADDSTSCDAKDGDGDTGRLHRTNKTQQRRQR